ncbi:CAP domain-containing protein [Nocardia sp. NPDC050406]|uniref:CAP domain-containing protein n=1 Tax=Nocardia sp. NPDC050406 TaxID=3364318 RepID=UPI003796D08B
MRTSKALILVGATSLCMLLSPPDTRADTENVSAMMATAVNQHRERHGVPALEVSAELAAGAQRWAERGIMESSPVDGSFGETLYTYSTRLDPRDAVEKAVAHWYDQSIASDGHPAYDYHHANNRENFLQVLGDHGCFAQLVWKNTTHVGTGVAWLPDKQITFVVARFSPPGNFAGEYHRNVFPPR